MASGARHTVGPATGAGPWKIGTLARRTGLSVRTLHWYDEIGLLRPTRHTASGHRLYGDGDVQRLQEIRSLRNLGFTLEEIRDLLRRPGFSPSRVLRLHLEELKTRIAQEQHLRRRLERLADRLDAAGTVSVDELMNAIEEITMSEWNLTPEQIAELQERRQKLGDAAIKAVEAEWPQLIAKVKAEMEKGTPVTDPRVQEMARRWKELVEQFTGGNKGIEKAVGQRYRDDPELRARTGIDGGVFGYVGQAWAAAKPK